VKQQETLSILAGLGVIKLVFLIIALTVFLGGCASDVPPAQLNPPPKYLMSPPAKFPTLKEGDDAAQKLAEAAEAHNRNARKIRGLQGYIKTSRKE
jgi:PBP1b-binding outer membrane lipoprotein LpoB